MTKHVSLTRDEHQYYFFTKRPLSEITEAWLRHSESCCSCSMPDIRVTNLEGATERDVEVSNRN